MKLKQPLPDHRSYEQLLNHYRVEKSIAQKLMQASREERQGIYATMYDELFVRVPDHPRLTRRTSEALTAIANRSKLQLIDRFLDKASVFVEFAPGDCKFSLSVAQYVPHVYGVDISDQHDPADHFPENFRLIVYDGYNLDEMENDSVDIVFSDQLIEHFHPEDTRLHFELVHRILKKGARYVFRTPHPLTGPHDVSRYFCDEPECFHLKEWTYIEMKELLLDIGYSGFCSRWQARNINIRLPNAYFAFCEHALGAIPKPYARGAARYLLPSLYGVAIK